MFCDTLNIFIQYLSNIRPEPICTVPLNSPTQCLQTHALHFCKGNHCPLQALFHPSCPRIHSAVSRSRWLQHDSAIWRRLWPLSMWFWQCTTCSVDHCSGDCGPSHRSQKCHWSIDLCWDVLLMIPPKPWPWPWSLGPSWHTPQLPRWQIQRLPRQQRQSADASSSWSCQNPCSNG